MKALRQRMTDDMVVRRMSERTQEAYLAAVAALARYYRRSPDQITDEEVQAYLRYLIRRPTVEPRDPRDRPQVRFPGLVGHPAHDHVVVQLST